LLLLSLIVLYTRIVRERFSWFDRLLFSIYLSWVSVAAMVNISYTLTHYGWSGHGISDVIWAVALIFMAAALAIIFRFAHHDRLYPLVFVWALVGIAVQNWSDEPFVAITALIFSVFTLFAAVLKNNG
jgi:benzodiazapine receptor